MVREKISYVRFQAHATHWQTYLEVREEQQLEQINESSFIMIPVQSHVTC